jgi:hypothetical protein
MPETRLVNKLKTTDAITAIVGQKVYPIDVPQERGVTASEKAISELPYITFQMISDQSINHSTGAREGSWTRVQVDLWAAEYPYVKALANAVKAALKNWTDDTGDPIITSCHYQTGHDLPEPHSPGEDQRVHRVSQDYRVQYVPA